MPGKKVVKAYLPVQMARAIEGMNAEFGISETEIMRCVFTEYAISRGYLAQDNLEPAELSDRPVQSTKDQAIINALKTAKEQCLIDWKIYEDIGISDRNVLDFLVNYALKSEGLKVD